MNKIETRRVQGQSGSRTIETPNQTLGKRGFDFPPRPWPKRTSFYVTEYAFCIPLVLGTTFSELGWRGDKNHRF